MSSDDSDDSEDDDFVVRRRDRGEEHIPRGARAPMFFDNVVEVEEVPDVLDEVLPLDDLPADDRDDEELPNLPELPVASGSGDRQPARQTRQEKKIWKWKKGDLEPQEVPENELKPRGMEEVRFPVDIFIKMFGWDTLELLCRETNIFRVSQDRGIGVISVSEIRQVIGILMYMSVVSMPNVKLSGRSP